MTENNPVPFFEITLYQTKDAHPTGRQRGRRGGGLIQMSNDIENTESGGEESPFERSRRTNDAGSEHWSSRDFAGVLGYTDYRNFEQVVGKARLAYFNSGQRIEDHFVDITEMIEIGKSIKKIEGRKRRQLRGGTEKGGT